ncbi:hypothetical protein C8R45DRAFT_833535 [Mycena sanguinolenta]|nr:hypothetical protein C8R45DRAFT_833535 [Mycena sanguinolenta]
MIDPTLLAQSAAARQGVASNAHWTERNEIKLLNHLIENCAAASDGITFKKPMWTAAAVAVNDDEHVKVQLTSFQLKSLYLLICKIIGNSGWTWNDKHGACITAASSGTWDVFVKSRRAAEPFRNAGWVHLDAFRDLMPDAIPKGTHVFRALGAFSQPEEEEEDNNGRYSLDWESFQKDSDGEDQADKENDEPHVPTPRTPAPPTTRKRAAAAPASGTAKKPRLSGGATALQGISEQMGDFNEIMRVAFGPTGGGAELPPTPIRLKNASKRAQKLETWMGKGDLLSLIDVLESSTKAVDAYDTLEDDELRVMWVKRKVGITE